jgi:PEGA domain
VASGRQAGKRVLFRRSPVNNKPLTIKGFLSNIERCRVTLRPMGTRVATALTFACYLSCSVASLVNAASQGHGVHGDGGHAGGRIRGPASRRSPSRPTAGSPPFTAGLISTSALPCRRFTPFIGTLFGAEALALSDPFRWSDSAAAEPGDESGTFALPSTAPVQVGAVVARGASPQPSSIQPQEPSLLPSSSASATGTLRLDVEPRTAQVYIDGFYVGSVAAMNGMGLTLRAGWHRLECRAPGYETPAVNVTVEAKRTTTYHLALQPAP